MRPGALSKRTEHVGARKLEEHDMRAPRNDGPVSSGTIMAVVKAEWISLKEKMACLLRLMTSAANCCPIEVGEADDVCSNTSLGTFFIDTHC